MNLLLDRQQSSRLKLRRIQKEDFFDWLPFFQDSTTSEHWIEPIQTPEIACEHWYQKQFNRYENNLGGMNALIEKESDKRIGHAGLLVQTVDDVTELEIAYSLLLPHWNKGFATEAPRKCMDYAVVNGLANTLISIVSTTNSASERVALKNGMLKSKGSVYRGNEFDIFRISISQWNSTTQPY